MSFFFFFLLVTWKVNLDAFGFEVGWLEQLSVTLEGPDYIPTRGISKKEVGDGTAPCQPALSLVVYHFKNISHAPTASYTIG